MAARRDIEHHPWEDEEIGDPWAFEDPPLNRTAIPYTDNDTAELVDRAVKDLTIFRGSSSGDTGAVVSVLVSLAGEAEGLLWDAVADARDHGYTWDEIADRLATSITTARRRYAGYTNWRRTQPTPICNPTVALIPRQTHLYPAARSHHNSLSPLLTTETGRRHELPAHPTTENSCPRRRRAVAGRADRGPPRRSEDHDHL